MLSPRVAGHAAALVCATQNCVCVACRWRRGGALRARLQDAEAAAAAAAHELAAELAAGHEADSLRAETRPQPLPRAPPRNWRRRAARRSACAARRPRRRRWPRRRVARWCGSLRTAAAERSAAAAEAQRHARMVDPHLVLAFEYVPNSRATSILGNVEHWHTGLTFRHVRCQAEQVWL